MHRPDVLYWSVDTLKNMIYVNILSHLLHFDWQSVTRFMFYFLFTKDANELAKHNMEVSSLHPSNAHILEGKQYYCKCDSLVSQSWSFEASLTNTCSNKQLASVSLPKLILNCHILAILGFDLSKAESGPFLYNKTWFWSAVCIQHIPLRSSTVFVVIVLAGLSLSFHF